MSFLLLLTLCGQPHIVEMGYGEKIQFLWYNKLPMDTKRTIDHYFKDGKNTVEIYNGKCA